jgi:hypothetical protein
MVYLRGKNRYNNVKIVIDDIVFDSKTEGNYYLFLKMRMGRGEISELYPQCPLLLDENDERLGMYFCDFAYRNFKGDLVYDEIKSPPTFEEGVFRLKMKILALKGIDINIYISNGKHLNSKSSSIRILEGKKRESIVYNEYNSFLTMRDISFF